jgi:hypothetical protein
VLLSYVLCSLLFTFPLVLRLSTHVPGQLEGDVPVYLWNLWWMNKALAGGFSPLFCEYLFAPYGVSLAFHAFVFLKALLAIPLQWVFSAWTAYNILVLFTFSMAGCAMFLLARHLTGDLRAAWVAGLVYGFSPYMLARGQGHLNYLSGEWMPLYVLCLLRLLEERKGRWAMGMGLFLLLTAYCEYYYLIYLVIFTGLYVGWRAWKEPEAIFNRAFLGRFSLAVGMAALGFAPILRALFNASQSEYIYGGWGGSAKLGADLLAFFTPPPGSLLYRDWSLQLFGRFSGGNWIEATVFAGYAVLALAGVCLGKLRRDEKVRPWLWLTLIFFLLSLGPLLHLGGDFVFGWGPLRFAVPLPYVALHYLPLVKGARVPARFDIMVSLGLAVLCAFALRWLLARVGRPQRWAMGIALLIGLEYLRLPYPTSPVSIPPLYQEMARDGRDVAVLEVPLGWRTGWGSTGRSFDLQQLYQMVHGKRLVGGFASRVPEDELERIADLPGVPRLLELQEEVELPPSPTQQRRLAIRAQLAELWAHLPDRVKERLRGDALVRRFLEGEPEMRGKASVQEDASRLVETARLGYVVVHPPYSGQESIRRYLEEALPLEKFYQHQGVVGYRVVQKAEKTRE